MIVVEGQLWHEKARGKGGESTIARSEEGPGHLGTATHPLAN